MGLNENKRECMGMYENIYGNARECMGMLRNEWKCTRMLTNLCSSLHFQET